MTRYHKRVLRQGMNYFCKLCSIFFTDRLTQTKIEIRPTHQKFIASEVQLVCTLKAYMCYKQN